MCLICFKGFGPLLMPEFQILEAATKDLIGDLESKLM